MKRNLETGGLTFSIDLPTVVRVSGIIFIAVGTTEGEDGSAGPQHVLSVARAIGEAMDGKRSATS